jgi:hypothetical protein
MFKPGEKVICVDDSRSLILQIGKMYTIESVSLDTVNVLNIDRIDYSSKNFLSIAEDRRRKLDKIISKIK